MNKTKSFQDIKDLLLNLGYKETVIPDIQEELDKLFKEIDFDRIKQRVESSAIEKDTEGLINSLQDLVVSLEDKGYYRPDFPTSLIRLLVNGLNLRNEDIFLALIKSTIPERDKSNDMELLASCAAITQLGYIFLSHLVPDVKAATAGPHVFLLIESFSSDSVIFVDFSIDSIKEIDINQLYCKKENNFHLNNEVSGSDEEISQLLKEYYFSFQVADSIGLSHNIHNNLGITYDKLGRYQEAVEEFNEALKLHPFYNEVQNNLAVTLFKIGRSEDAIELLQKAIKLNPEYAEAHSNLGNMYANSGKINEAIKELEEAVRLNPDFAGAHNNLGNIYAEQKKNEEAIKEFQEAIRLDPDYTLAHFNLGNMYSELEMNEKAVKEYEYAAGINPGFTEAFQGLGSIYYELGSYSKAVNAWINAVHLEPELMESVPEELLLKVKMGISRLKRRI